MINPAEIPDAFGPFFKVLDTIQENLAAIIPKAQDQPTREMFAGLLAELQARHTEFAVIGPQAMADGIAKTNAALGKMSVLEQKSDTLVADIQDMLAKSAASHADAEAELAVLKAQPKPEPDMPRRSLKKKVLALELSTGGDLRKLLMLAPSAAKKAPSPHISGNIWENWGPLSSAPPTPEEEDSQDQDSDYPVG